MPHPTRCNPRGALPGMAALLISAVIPVQAAGRFEVHATLSPAAEVQHGASYRLKGRLGVPPATTLVQLGTRHSLSASLVESPLVCYSDTIFRDGFDG